MKINFKRAAAFFMTFLFLFQITVFAVSSESKNTQIAEVENYEHVLNLFTVLGIIEDYDSFNPEKQITRGYFSQVAARITQINFEGMATEQRFADVLPSSMYADAIECLYSNGIITGNSNGEFKVNEVIKVIDALKILMSVTGYAPLADINGGYPDGYVYAAARGDMLNGLGNIYGELTAPAMLVLVGNVMNSPKIEFNYESKGFSYKFNEEKTILNDKYDVNIADGTVTQNSLTAFYSASDLKEDCIEIETGSIKRQMVAKNCENYLGKTIRTFYKEENDENVSIYAYPLPSHNNVVELNIDDIELSSSNQNKIKYYDGKHKYLNCDINVAVIYNDMYYAEGMFNFSVLEGKRGSVEFVDNNKDNTYDVIKIKAYSSHVIGNILIDDQIIYDKFNQNVSIDVSPNDCYRYSMKFTDGTDASLYDIVELNVISVAQSSNSADRKITDIIISRNVQSGKITRIENRGGVPYVTIDGINTYKTTDDIISSFKITVGNEMNLFLDAFDNIVGADALVAGEYRFGLLLGYKADKGYKLEAKLLTASNTFETFQFAKKFWIDNQKITEADKGKNVLDIISANTIVGTSEKSLVSGVFPVRYVLNSDGEILKLDTPEKGANEDKGLKLLTGAYQGPGTYAVAYDNVLGCRIPLKSETVVIRMNISDYTSKSAYTKESFTITNASQFANSADVYFCVAYKVDEDSPYADLVLVLSGISVQSDTYTFTIKDFIKVYDEKLECVVEGVVGIQQGSEQSISIDPEYADEFLSMGLNIGDTIRYSKNTRTGLVKKVQIVSQYVDDNSKVNIVNVVGGTTDITGSLKIYTQKRVLLPGFIAERTGNLIKLAYTGFGTQDKRPTADTFADESRLIYCQPGNSTVVTVYDPSKKQPVYAGTYDEMKDYVHSGLGASRVIVRYRSNLLEEIIVYNDDSVN